MDANQKLTELLQPYLNDDGSGNPAIYIVDIQIAGKQGGRLKVTILLDSDTGITIDECARISRQLGAQLDEIDLFEGRAFTLEVSSPGVDFPLQSPRQYRKNIGRSLHVLLDDGTVRDGKLADVTDGHIVLDIAPARKSKPKKKVGTDEAPAPEGPTPIPFEHIKKANVAITFK